MSKFNLGDVTSGVNLQAVNDNFERIADEINNKLLYRANPVGDPNEMHNDLDMNSNHILNLPMPLNASEAARLQDVIDAVAGVSVTGLPNPANKNLSMAGFQIKNLGAPTSPSDAARFQDVQDAIAGSTTALLTSFVPAGTISSTNVQNALQELDGDIQAIVAHPPTVPTITVASVAALRALTLASTNQYVRTAGYYSRGDGGSAMYFYDSSDTTSTDNGFNVIVGAGAIRWKLMLDGTPPNIAQAGCLTNGSDCGPGFTFITLILGLPCRVPKGTWTIGTSANVGALIMDPGAVISIAAGQSILFTVKPIAAPDRSIFAGSGNVALAAGAAKWQSVSVDWFPSAATNLGAIAGACWGLSNNILALGTSYPVTSAITPPQGRQGLTLRGAGYRSTVFVVSPAILGVDYVRTSTATGASELEISGIEWNEAGAGKTATAIRWWGAATGSYGAETAFADDNWLRVKDCHFVGFGKGSWTRYCGFAHFERNFYLNNGMSHFKERDSSFHYHFAEMTLNGANYIYQDDPTNDARSNALFVTDCQSVLATGIDVRLKNYQLATFKGCVFDLGGVGEAALYCVGCQDVHYSDGWLASSAAAAAAGRDGLVFNACRNSSAHDNTVVNCSAGIVGIGSTAISVHNNVFESNLGFDITDVGAPIGWTVMGNISRTVVSGAPIGLSGGSSNLVVGNVSKQSYTPSGGSGGVVANNLGGAAL